VLRADAEYCASAEELMEMKSAEDFDQDLLILFDAYVHGDIDRRGFLEKAARFAAGGVTASMLLAMLSPNFAEAQQVPKDDARLKTEYAEYESPKGYGKMRGYLARPAKATGKLPAILVIHENRGLNPHIEDITRRLALENFMAFAPDALFPLGGYPGTEDDARALFPKLDQTKTREDFVAAVEWLMKRPDSTGKVGVVGFPSTAPHRRLKRQRRSKRRCCSTSPRTTRASTRASLRTRKR
jgi:carboxymethylenebutenolidase